MCKNKSIQLHSDYGMSRCTCRVVNAYINEYSPYDEYRDVNAKFIITEYIVREPLVYNCFQCNFILSIERWYKLKLNNHHCWDICIIVLYPKRFMHYFVDSMHAQLVIHIPLDVLLNFWIFNTICTKKYWEYIEIMFFSFANVCFGYSTADC